MGHLNSLSYGKELRCPNIKGKYVMYFSWVNNSLYASFLRLLLSAFLKVGGFDEMVEKYPDSMSNFTRYSNTSCGRPEDDYMHLFRDPVSGDLPWPGILGVTINSIWYWCSDQVGTFILTSCDYSLYGS